jgi:hypothetical protein
MLDASRQFAGELLALCLPGTSGQTPACPALNSDDAHWEDLISQAIQQGVAPLMAVRSRSLALPVAIRERLESFYRANAMRNLRLAAEESRLSAALSGARIPHWTLKGPGLSERLYGDIGVRQISDLDMLIAPASLARTDALLAEIGFRRQTTGTIASLAAAQELIYVRESLEPGSRGTASLPASGSSSRALTAGERSDAAHSANAPATYLDLHQRLLPYVRRDALAVRVFREGMTAENLLLYLCANQITHRFARLRYLCDVSAFLDREGKLLDWDCFLKSARGLPWGPGIGLSLRWASQFTRQPAPEQVLRDLRPNPLGDLLLRRAIGASPAQAASRTRLLDSSAGAAIPVAAAYLGRPSAYGIAWNLLVPSRAYLREQTGATPGEPLATAYATRILRKIPGALRHLLRSTA